MRFTHGDEAYRLEFTREWQEVVPPHVKAFEEPPIVTFARAVFRYLRDLPVTMLNKPLYDAAEAIVATADATPVVKRPRTTVMLHREVTSPSPIDPAKTEMTFVEIGHASVRFYHKDGVETREEGRRQALRRLCPFIPEELRPLVWQCYLERPRAVSDDIQKLAAVMRKVLPPALLAEVTDHLTPYLQALKQETREPV